MKARLIDANTVLRAHELRVTKPRLALFAFFAKQTSPVLATQIEAALPSIDRATIYRTLEHFLTAGILKTVQLGGATRYEQKDEHDHHHIVCTNCGYIEDISLCAMTSLLPALQKATRRFATFTDHQFEIFGVCKSCIKRN